MEAVRPQSRSRGHCGTGSMLILLLLSLASGWVNPANHAGAPEATVWPGSCRPTAWDMGVCACHSNLRSQWHHTNAKGESLVRQVRSWGPLDANCPSFADVEVQCESARFLAHRKVRVSSPPQLYLRGGVEISSSEHDGKMRAGEGSEEEDEHKIGNWRAAFKRSFGDHAQETIKNAARGSVPYSDVFSDQEQGEPDLDNTGWTMKMPADDDDDSESAQQLERGGERAGDESEMEMERLRQKELGSARPAAVDSSDVDLSEGSAMEGLSEGGASGAEELDGLGETGGGREGQQSSSEGSLSVSDDALDAAEEHRDDGGEVGGGEKQKRISELLSEIDRLRRLKAASTGATDPPARRSAVASVPPRAPSDPHSSVTAPRNRISQLDRREGGHDHVATPPPVPGSEDQRRCGGGLEEDEQMDGVGRGQRGHAGLGEEGDAELAALMDAEATLQQRPVNPVALPLSADFLPQSPAPDSWTSRFPCPGPPPHPPCSCSAGCWRKLAMARGVRWNTDQILMDVDLGDTLPAPCMLEGDTRQLPPVQPVSHLPFDQRPFRCMYDGTSFARPEDMFEYIRSKHTEVHNRLKPGQDTFFPRHRMQHAVEKATENARKTEEHRVRMKALAKKRKMQLLVPEGDGEDIDGAEEDWDAQTKGYEAMLDGGERRKKREGLGFKRTNKDSNGAKAKGVAGRGAGRKRQEDRKFPTGVRKAGKQVNLGLKLKDMGKSLYA